MKYILLSTFALAACAGPTVVKPFGKGQHEITYTESSVISSPALVTTNMNQEIRKICPNGFNKVSEKTLYTEKMPTHVWVFSCIDH